MIAPRVIIAYALLGALLILLSDQLLDVVIGVEASSELADRALRAAAVFLAACAVLFLAFSRIASRHNRARAAQATAETRLRDFLETSADWQCEIDRNLRFSAFSPCFRRITGIEPRHLIGKSPQATIAAPVEVEGFARHLEDLRRHRPFRDVTYPIRNGAGRLIYARLSGKPLFDSAGTFQGYRCLGTDITGAVESRETQSRLAAILEVTPDLVATADREGRLCFLNRAGHSLTGLEPEASFDALTLADLFGPDARQQFEEEMLPTAVRKGLWRGECQLIDGAGHEKPALLTLLVHRGGDGAVAFLSLVAHDLSERKEVEAHFARSRRLEAIGQLSAGIAHDFNNLLLIILGNAELLESDRSTDPRLRQSIAAIRQASGRAAELTDRLLTFARQRSLKPEQVDLERLIADMLRLLQRTLGESVQVQLALAPSLQAVFVDRSELETALLNLSINARDAMPRGGKLTIEAQNTTVERDSSGPRELDAGDYVVISVSDTGAGMSQEVAERAFEPFFTTKEPGQGTGLGLSMAFGFAKQSGGHLSIYSEAGRGTTVRLYLPRRREERPSRPQPQPALATVPCGHERILIVEDEALVRQFVEAQLATQGYRVASAGNGEDALALLRADPSFDLMLTDIVMPGRYSGPELATAAQRIVPALKVVYTTGYAQQAALAQRGLPSDAPVLSKPYSRSALAQLLRSELEPHLESQVESQLESGIEPSRRARSA